jgi:RNA polymerase sigma factor (sigma-70 family)
MSRRGLESTAVLLARVREGDVMAREDLAVRYRTLLTRWAHGRLPPAARSVLETSDLVQTTLMRAFARVDRFEPRHEGAFLAYLRQILLNQIRDESRRRKRRPVSVEPLPEGLEDRTTPSPLEAIIGAESLARYEEALARLTARQREAIILRLELGLRYREVAEAIDAPSVNAARLIVARALVRLAAALGDDDEAPGVTKESP